MSEKPSSDDIQTQAMAANDTKQTTSAAGERDEPQAQPIKGLLFKFISAGFSFFVAGVNDGSLGALVPYVSHVYGLNLAVVSSLYAASFAGWLTTAILNTHLSQRFRVGAMMLLGAAMQVVAHTLRTWPTPPFGLYVFTYWLVSTGQAFQDTHSNTFVASASAAGGTTHRWLGFIHAMYTAGCFVAPFAAASIAGVGAVDVSPWYLFYAVPLGLGLVNIGLVLTAFRDVIGFHSVKPEVWSAVAHEEEGKCESGPGIQQGGSRMEAEIQKISAHGTAMAVIKDVLSRRSVWLLCLFYFFYLGAAITAGGWIVEYLVTVRGGNVVDMGYVSAGFGGGSLLGRILLPEPTHRLGERWMVFLYCVFCLGFQLVFWLVPNIIAAAVAISFVGFFTGPFFSVGLTVAARVLPPEINATAISFVFVFAQMGGCLFPIITGFLGAYVGVAVMQPIMVGLIVAMAVSWLFVPQQREEGSVRVIV